MPSVADLGLAINENSQECLVEQFLERVRGLL
jgi:hypothetical protein